MKARWMWFGGKMVLMVTGLALVLGGLTMLMWNALIPSLFHGPEITYLQALGVLILTRLLFGGWGRHRGGWRDRRWRGRRQDHFAKLSPEEQEKMKSDWRSYCAWHEEAPPEKDEEHITN
jgi:hypothetical protein